VTPLFIDTETYSSIPLTRGLARYATQVEVTIVAWALGDGPVNVWDATGAETLPADLAAAIDQANRLVAHNAQFDRTVLRNMAWWPSDIPLGTWYCTMARALRHGLPGGLDKLSIVFRLDSSTAKLDGRRFINLFCKPQKDGSRLTRETNPDDWRDFMEYAGRDITSMRAIYADCPSWNDTPFELALWQLDQEINSRGIAVDTVFAAAALHEATAEKKRMAARTEELTDGTVLRATQRDRLLGFLFAEHGVSLPDLKADTVERRLNDPNLGEEVKELLRLRLSSSKSSVTKYKRLLDLEVCGRLHFLLQYCGAPRTGRWGGRDFQPQNLQRPTLKYADVLVAIDAAVAGAADLVLDDIMEAMGSALRSVLVAGHGRKLVASDLAAIEGRMLAWVAGEEWKLQAFRDFDAGVGPDLYKASYGRSFGVPAETVPDDSDERQIGKVQELALGYQGGVGAFCAMAASYGMDLAELAVRARPSIPAPVLADAEGTWQWAVRKRRTMGLTRDVYVICEALKRLWRDAHPETAALWTVVENAARSATLNPGHEYRAGRLAFDRRGAWLRMRLPSGRFLLYPNPKVEGGELSFMSWNVYTKKWAREPTHGGKLVGNATQGLARDVMAHGMVLADTAGYPIVLTVHDEIVADVPNSDAFSSAELSEFMAVSPAWAVGLPLAAKGFESHRYRKG